MVACHAKILDIESLQPRHKSAKFEPDACCQENFILFLVLHACHLMSDGQVRVERDGRPESVQGTGNLLEIDSKSNIYTIDYEMICQCVKSYCCMSHRLLSERDMLTEPERNES